MTRLNVGETRRNGKTRFFAKQKRAKGQLNVDNGGRRGHNMMIGDIKRPAVQLSIV